MSDEAWYRQAIDSGEEDYVVDDFNNNDYLSGIDFNSNPNTGVQTTPAGVSAANAGRVSDPSHLQPNKEPLGGDQTLLNSHPAANTFNPDFVTNLDSSYYPWMTYDTSGTAQTSDYLAFQDGLPVGSYYQPDMPLQAFGQPSDGDHVSLTTAYGSSFSSSATSSVASEGMASMTLSNEPMQSNRPSVGVSRPTTFSEPAWARQPSTISPEMLRINRSPTPTSSSESMQTNFLASGDSDIGSSAFGQHHGRDQYPPKRSSHKQRKELPNKPTKPRPMPYIPGNASFSEANADPSYYDVPYIRPMPEEGMPTRPASLTPSAQATENERVTQEERAAKDQYLISSKLAGMTYREIRKKGGFTEAESTLRGRFRTLTKTKEARVRKPEWQDDDIRLLMKAVRKLARVGKDEKDDKVPWKQVADYITEHGGSYHFGNATCRKKWDDLVQQGRASLK